MAGESPDKSEQRKSSGETTDSERDPRLGVAMSAAGSAAPGRKAGSGAGAEAASEAADADGDGRDRKKAGAPEGDARLKAAVAAWVAESDAPDDEANSGSEKPGVPEPRSASDEDKPGVPEARSASDAEKPADRAATAAGAKPESDDKKPADKADKADKPAADEKSASGDDKPQAEGKKPTDRATAVFGAVKPQAEAEKPAGKGEAKSEPETGGKKPTDQATAVFGAVKPAGDKPKAEAEKPTGKGEDKKPTDQATAVFRTVKPAAGEKPTDQATAAFGTVKPAPKADAPKADAPKGADQPTELLKAPPVPPAGKPASQFVPLKKDDAPKAAPKPAAKPAADKPAVPVSVPPPVAPAPQVPGAPQEPKAPLDLLAQLTNTPPPAQTPTRTVMRRVKIWTPLVVLLAIVFVVVQAFRPLPAPKLALVGKSSFVFEGEKPALPWPTEGQAVVDVDGLGRVGSYGEMKSIPIGSVAKVMTTYLILRDHPLKKGETGQEIDVDQKAEDDFVNGDKEHESVVEVHKGQKISEKEALEAVMLPSANNVARLLARWDAGSEEAFIKKMNDTAKSFGMTNTTYTDASGLIESTVSTAEDQVKLGKKAMQDEVFREISRATQYNSTTASGSSSRDAYRKTQPNFNKLVPSFGVVGIKTGSTTKAGGNLLFAAEKKVGSSKQLIIGAVFGQHKSPIIDTVTAYSKDLILATGKMLTTSTVVKKGDVVGHVDDGLGGTTPVVAAKDMTVAGWPGLKIDLKLDTNGKAIPHTAKAGTEVGSLTVGGGTGEIRVPVTLQKDLAEPSFGSKLTRLG
ncbi:hypothetical protein VR41_09120 [Streptomyces sp. NRRL B-1568]|nr:hypothetical protein VR41_09120 [Streptomyces sp. NRRL B-1568]